MTEEELAYFEDTACPTCGSCSGMFTANSMNCLCEALGIALPGNGTVPAVYSERIRLAKRAGMKVMELLRDNVRHRRDILNAAAVRNAMECDMAFGGSTNTVLHLTAIANAGGVPHHHGRLGCGQRAHAAPGEARALRPAPASSTCTRAGGVPGGHGASWRRLGLLDEQRRSPCMGALCPSTWRGAARPRPTARCAARARTPISRQGALKVLLRQPGARRLAW